MGKNKEKKKRDKLQKLFNKLHGLIKFVKHIYRYEIHGNTKKYNDGALICIGNHYSYLDVLFPCLVTDRPVRFIAKQQLWDDGGLLKKFVVACGCIPVKRDGSDVQAVKDCMRILRDGGVINIFPEGTRNKSYGSILPFHSGASTLSIKTRTPIIPIVKVTRLRPFKKTHVIIGDPIEFRQYYGKKISKEQIDECDEILRRSMENMRLAFIEKHGLKFKSDKV